MSLSSQNKPAKVPCKEGSLFGCDFGGSLLLYLGDCNAWKFPVIQISNSTWTTERIRSRWGIERLKWKINEHLKSVHGILTVVATVAFQVAGTSMFKDTEVSPPFPPPLINMLAWSKQSGLQGLKCLKYSQGNKYLSTEYFLLLGSSWWGLLTRLRGKLKKTGYQPMTVGNLSG